MRVTARTSTVTGALALAAVLAAPAAALAQSAEYNGGEDTAVQPTVLQRSDVRPASTTSTPSTLPFTGGEVVLIAVAGAAAVAAGTAMVVTGRRRIDAQD
jgi:hypothetical protein